MGKIAWLDAKKLNPEVTLKKIQEVATVQSTGTISFANFSYFEYLGIIQSQLKFPKACLEIGEAWIIEKAVSQCLQLNNLDKTNLVRTANDVLSNALAKREDTYHLLTSISVDSSFPFRKLNLAGCEIRFYTRKYPVKFQGRDATISPALLPFNGEHKGYLKCVITVKAKYSKAATNRALFALDYLRAVFCLFANPDLEFNFGVTIEKPINVIRLGQVHTLHGQDGEILADHLWYEPNFYEFSTSLQKHREVLKKNFLHIKHHLSECPYGDDLINSLVRYVRACDEKDSNNCLVKLWGVLESLLSPDQASHEYVVNRGASLHADKLFHQHALDHLRRFRNKNIHAGEESERSKVYCFQIQRYYQRLIRFHLANVRFFSSLGEANKFLDLPHDHDTLKRRGELIKKALADRFDATL